MAINFATVKTSMYQWMITVIPTGMPAIYWEPNAPRPTVPYVTMFLQSIVSVGQDWASGSSDLVGVVNQKGDRQFTFSVQAYGGDPLTLLENIRTSLQKQTVLDTLRTSGIAFYSAMTINDISGLVDSEWERRASLDIIFGIGQIYTDAPGFFDHIQLQEQVFDQTGFKVFDQTITIPNP